MRAFGAAFERPPSEIQVPGFDSRLCLQCQRPAHAHLGGAGSRVPATLVGDPDGILSAWLQPGLVVAMVGV